MLNKEDTYYPLMAFLTYQSYESNRDQNPEIEAKRWEALYDDAAKMEEIYMSKKLRKC